MEFGEKFLVIMEILLALPFLFILKVAQSGAEDCLNNIAENVPTAVSGNMVPIQNAGDKYCNPTTGKFAFVEKLADLTAKTYQWYFLVSLFISFILTLCWEFV